MSHKLLLNIIASAIDEIASECNSRQLCDIATDIRRWIEEHLR